MKTRFYYQIDYIDENGFANYIDTFCENKLKKAKKHWKILSLAQACISRDTYFVLDMYSYQEDETGLAFDDTDEWIKQILPERK